MSNLDDESEARNLAVAFVSSGWGVLRDENVAAVLAVVAAWAPLPPPSWVSSGWPW